MDWVSILGAVSIWIILLPFVIGVVLFKKLDSDSKLILLVVISGTIPQVLRPYIDNTSSLNVLYNLYTPLEFAVYWILFRRKIVNASRRKLLYIIAGLFFSLSLFLVSEIGIRARFLNEWVIVSNIFQIVFICLCLLEFYYSEESRIELAQPFFWFLTGITFYASCTSVFFCLWYFIKNNPDEHYQILNLIHHVFNIFLYIFFSVGLVRNISILKKIKNE